MNDQAPSAVPAATLGTVRHILQFLAGAAVSRGIVSDSDTALIVGAGVFAVTLAWSWISKRNFMAALQDAIDAPVGKAKL